MKYIYMNIYKYIFKFIIIIVIKFIYNGFYIQKALGET